MLAGMASTDAAKTRLEYAQAKDRKHQSHASYNPGATTLPHVVEVATIVQAR